MSCPRSLYTASNKELKRQQEKQEKQLKELKDRGVKPMTYKCNKTYCNFPKHNDLFPCKDKKH